MVGVAISAALLPPVCNAGSYFAYGIILVFRADLNTNSSYSQELFRALMSFCLFMLNFISIFVTALIFYRIKGIKPGFSVARVEGWKDVEIVEEVEELEVEPLISYQNSAVDVLMK